MRLSGNYKKKDFKPDYLDGESEFDDPMDDVHEESLPGRAKDSIVSGRQSFGPNYAKPEFTNTSAEGSLEANSPEKLTLSKFREVTRGVKEILRESPAKTKKLRLSASKTRHRSSSPYANKR